MKAPSQADQLVELASQRFTFHRSAEGELFTLPIVGPRIARPLRGNRSVRAELAALYVDQHGKAASASALADALLVVEGRCAQGEVVPTHLRIAAADDGEAVLDLGRDDGLCVVLQRGSWELRPTSVVFRRTRLTAPMVSPLRPGDVRLLRALLNVDDASWPLLVAWLVSCLLPWLPTPILLFTGEQGSAKSWAARLLVRVVDPSAAETRSEPRDPTDWAVSASGSWVVAVDNVSRVSSWWSDALCRAVTGEGFLRRALYSDNDLSVLAFRRRLIMTSIEPGAMRGDLADRILTVDLERIPPARRLEETDLESRFAEHHAAILAGVLDVAADVLRILPTVTLSERPRMADFARILAAVDHLLGTTGLGTYIERSRRVVADVLESDLVGQAIQARIEQFGPMEGSAGDLLTLLTPDRVPRRWPLSPQAMAAAFRRLAPSLREVGINVSYERTGHEGRRVYRLERRG